MMDELGVNLSKNALGEHLTSSSESDKQESEDENSIGADNDNHIDTLSNDLNDLEVYTIERPSKDKLEEICGLKQPVIFDYNNDDIITNINFDMLEHKYGAFDLKLRDIKNFDENTELHLPFITKEVRAVFDGDNNSKYITENKPNTIASSIIYYISI